MHRRLIVHGLATAVLSLSAAPAAAQLDALNRSRAETMLELTRQTIASQFYDSTYHGIDLAARYDTAVSRIRQSTDFDRALSAIAQFALDLHDSHTFFIPPERTARAEYGWDMAMIGDTCFVVSVDAGSDAEHQGVHPGDAVLSLNGYAPTRDNLVQLLYLFRLLRPQRSLHAMLRAPAGATRTLDLAARVRESKHIVDLTGNDGGDDIVRLIRDAEKDEQDMRSKVMSVGDSLLVWRLPTFDVSTTDIGDVVKLARGKRTLILDLRSNSGGSVRVLTALLGRLSPGPVTIGIQHERRGQSPLVADGAGDDAFTGALIVLVDSRSASASEVAARVAQLTKRGRVIGDRTAGAVMRARYHGYSIGTQTMIFYGINVTDADLEMSDGGRLEGVGVVPDEIVLPTAQDLAAGRDPALARAMTRAGRPTSAEEAGEMLARMKR